MTRVHPIRGFGCRGLVRVVSGSWLVLGVAGLFFEPANHGLTMDAKRPFKAAQTATLLVGAQDLLAPFGCIANRRRIVAALALAIAAQVFLFAVGCNPVFDHSGASAVATAY